MIRSIGKPGIEDPGSPPANYSCRTRSCNKFVKSSFTTSKADTVSADSLTKSSAISKIKSSDIGTGLPLVTISTTQPGSTAAYAGVSPTQTPSDSVLVASSNGLSTGTKAAIGTCSAIGLLLLIVLVVVLLRKRRRHRDPYKRNLKAHIRHHHGFGSGPLPPPPPADSPTPLISPTNSTSAVAAAVVAPLTPPARLRDRKLLPSILRPGSGGGGGGRASSPPLTSLSPPRSPVSLQRGQQYGHPLAFPSANICSPTTSKLQPRHERMLIIYGGGAEPKNTGSVRSTAKRSSVSSYAASGTNTASSSLRNEFGRITSKSTASSIAATVTAQQPLGPSRPGGTHGTPFEVPDPHTRGDTPSFTLGCISPTLHSSVSPIGPPPQRALPVPPVSPASTNSFQGLPTALRPAPPPDKTPAAAASAAVPLTSVAPDSKGLPQEVHDLTELTKEYAREKRESWRSSWTMGGGRPGAVAVPPGRSRRGVTAAVSRGLKAEGGADEDNTTCVPPPLLQEKDLETLGGQY